MNEEIEMLYKKIEGQDKIINEQALEISRLKEKIGDRYYKTFNELKEELGEDFEIFLYNSNIELLDKIDKAIECIKTTIKIIKEQPSSCELHNIWILEHLNSFLEILGDKENE